MARPRAIVPVSTERNFIRMMVYGPPGTGKSVLAGTSPKALILASDGEETLSAARNGSDADMWVVPDYGELEEAVEWVRHEGVNEYEWVWLDNGTLFQEQGMDDTMADLLTQHPERNRWVPDKQQYLINQNRLGGIIRQLKGLPIHFGITAHEMRVTWADGTENLMPLLQGKQGEYSQKICGYMNMVGYMTARNLKGGKFETKLRVRKSSTIYAKDRYAVFGREVLNPNIAEMMEEIQKVLPTLGTRVAPKRVTKSTATKKAAAKKVTTTRRRARA